MQNYANDVVAGVKDACDERKIPVPIIISESGRAIASHQSVLVFDVLGTSDVPREVPEPIDENAHQIPRNLNEIYQSISPENYQEVYHDAIQFKEEAVSLFNLGYLGIAERAKTEQLYWACCEKQQGIAAAKRICIGGFGRFRKGDGVHLLHQLICFSVSTG